MSVEDYLLAPRALKGRYPQGWIFGHFRNLAGGYPGLSRAPRRLEVRRHKRSDQAAANGVVLLRRDVIGQFFDRGVEEFDGKQPKQRTDHRHIPGKRRSDEDPGNEPRHQQDHLFAQRRLIVKTEADSP
jgi:hypothetical protein